MTFLKLPLILAAVVLLPSVDAACVEDNCYGAVYWNPAGAEECSGHFITTVIPSPSTTTLTITSAVADATTITGPFVGASTVVPSEVIPTYIVRACFGDVSYRFESACSCIGAGPTITTAAIPVATNTIIVPFTTTAAAVRPLTTERPLMPVPIIVDPGREPACVPVGMGPVIVTVQVDEVFAMSLTVFGPTLCIGEATPPPPPSSLQSSECNCASTLPSSAPFSSSFTRLAISNETSSISTESFSTVFRTSYYTPTPSSGFFNRSTAATSEPSTTLEESATTSQESATTSEEPTSTPAPTSLETSTSAFESTSFESTSFEPTSFESITSSHSFQPFETRNVSTSASTVEPSSTESSGGPSRTSTSDSSGPTHFIPRGREIYLLVTGGTYDGQYIETDEPDATVTTNLRSHVTTDLDFAAVWTLDAQTGVLFQEIAGAWWGAYFGFGSRTLWSAIYLFPADTVVSWLVTPVAMKAPLKCVIDFTADDSITCGQQAWTMLMQSDKCGFSITTPRNPFYAAACPESDEVVLRAVEVNPEDEGISK